MFNTLILIIMIDVAVVGFYFGGSALIERYSIVSDFTEGHMLGLGYSRLEMIKFALVEFKRFFIFGYGVGGFEQIFKINFNLSSGYYANHAHNDFIEFAGEFGIVGSLLLILLFVSYFVLVFCVLRFPQSVQCK